MKMISNRDACNWCGRVIELVEGKKYCDECCRCCKRKCRTCHKPYSSLKYFPNSDAECCNSCTKRNKKIKTKYTKNEAIAMSTKNRKISDDEGRVDSKMLESSTTPPPSSSKKKCRTISTLDDISDSHSTTSSSYSVSDNESVEEVDLLGKEGNNKISDYSDNEPEEVVMKKSRQKNRDNNRTANEMLKAAEDKKKHTDNKNTYLPIQQKRKRAYNRRPNMEKTPAQAEKDLMKALVNYKKALPLKAQINVVFVPE